MELLFFFFAVLFAMDQNTKDVLMVLIPLTGTCFAGWIAYRQKILETKQEESKKEIKDELTLAKQETKDELKGIKDDVSAVHETTNSKMDALLAEARKLAHFQGMRDEADQQKVRETEQAKGAAAAGVAATIVKDAADAAERVLTTAQTKATEPVPVQTRRDVKDAAAEAEKNKSA